MSVGGKHYMINTLPQKLKELRLANGYSQKTVADKIGSSPSIISGYETGERTPSTQNLLALSYLYKCSTDYLLGRTTDKPDAVINVDGLSPEHIEVLQSLIKVMKHE
jgi:transcriptional regulator with XRE-family HTH domain